MRGIVACLSGGLCSITAARIVQDLGYRLGTGMFVHSGMANDAENLAFAKQQAEYLAIPLHELTVSGLEYPEISAISIASLAVQVYDDFDLTGVVLGVSMRGIFDPLRSEVNARWRSMQQRLTSAFSLFVEGPCNIHLPLLDMDDAAITAQAKFYALEQLGKLD